ncbi:MAG: SAM-dependent methyltransferase [Micrococcales bacterium]|nr:MAG: SAM-dependent methyltransferase [Micrococcales bacterium]PIE25839.1 MAG: SAM-dependent methyltransferase [Micrococcales bacterium]
MWTQYNADRAEHVVRPLLADVLEHAGPGAGRLAIDLGAGAGVESHAMLAAGWRVLAVDGDPTTAPRIRQRCAGSVDRLQVQTRLFRDVTELPAADLVYSGYALPYATPDVFPTVWRAIRDALKPGAWLAVHLFGERDSMRADGEPATFLTREQAEALLSGLRVVTMQEEDAQGQSFRGPKHWHVFHVIARNSPAA